MFRGPLLVLLARFALLLACYSLVRKLFVLLNADQFSGAPLSAYLGGVRFDISALAWLNLPWVLFCLILPRPKGRWVTAQRVTFLVVNALGLFFACIDLEYYKFSMKRSTADFLDILAAGSDTVNLAPAFVRDYWFIVLIYAALLWSLWWGYGRLARLDRGERLPVWRSIMWRAIAVVLIAIGSRGGTQLMPLQVMAAAGYAPAHFVPVVLNTPFTLMSSLGKPVLAERTYMAQPQADLLWPVIQHYLLRTAPALHIPDRPNVVVIILESFSAAYSAKLAGGPGYMPFLDELMGQSVNMTRAYANARRSIDGVPAITASMPELMDEAFITSNYAQQPFTSLASVLGAEGYATSFYHGGNNGTMGFDGYARSAGFQRYVGRQEYPVQDHYDGHWGIWDAPFLQFYTKELTKEKEPFMSCLFTLSSHHPYHLQPDMAERFAGGTQKIHPTLRYTDEALRRFFDTARSQPWFKNTLFVITADHTADLERDGQNYSKAIDYWIPMLYHMPAYLAPADHPRVTQHIDVLPTILDMIGYHKPFFSFGHSAIRPASPPYAVMASNQIYHMIGDRFQIGFNGEELLGVEQLGTDTVGAMGEPRELVAFDMLMRTQAAIQQFNHHLLQNSLTVPAPAP